MLTEIRTVCGLSLSEVCCGKCVANVIRREVASRKMYLWQQRQVTKEAEIGSVHGRGWRMTYVARPDSATDLSPSCAFLGAAKRH